MPRKRCVPRTDRIFSAAQREHDDEEQEHGDRTGVDEDLYERHELGGEQQEQTGDREHDLEQPERGVHDVAR